MYGISAENSAPFGGAYDRVEVRLPPNMPPGAIVGKAGGNIRMLQQRSGAKIEMLNNPATRKFDSIVVISGPAISVETAKKLLNAQVEAFLASGGAYPHPLKVLYLLDTAFGDSPQQAVTFAARTDEVSRDTSRPEQLHVLQPLPAAAAPGAGPGAVAHFDSSYRRLNNQDSAEMKTPFYLHSQQEELLQEVLSAVRAAVVHRPMFDSLKLSFNLGKQFMYNGTHPGQLWTIKQLQAKEVPHDFKCVFSNAATSHQVPVITSWLKQHGFTQLEVKDTVSVHVHHRATAAGYTLSIIKSSDGKLTFRKAKSQNSKLAFVTLVASPDSPDWRAKLLAQYHLQPDSDIYKMLREAASEAELASGLQLHIPSLEQRDMYVDSERHKHKTVYQGIFSSQDPSFAQANAPSTEGDDMGSNRARTGVGMSTLIKLTISRVQTVGSGRTSLEIAGTSPQVNELLFSMLQSSRVDAEQEEELLAHLQNMLSLAKQLVSSASV